MVVVSRGLHGFRRFALLEIPALIHVLFHEAVVLLIYRPEHLHELQVLHLVCCLLEPNERPVVQVISTLDLSGQFGDAFLRALQFKCNELLGFN